jgi:hypothetical protein
VAPEHDGAALIASELLLLRQCFLVWLYTVFVEVDFVGLPNLVDCVVDLYVLLIYVVLLNCPEIPVYPSWLGRNTTIPRRNGSRGSGLRSSGDVEAKGQGFRSALEC